ncbi:MAG: hypothetical protein ACK55Z_07905, partial [bacterium]
LRDDIRQGPFRFFFQLHILLKMQPRFSGSQVEFHVHSQPVLLRLPYETQHLVWFAVALLLVP